MNNIEQIKNLVGNTPLINIKYKYNNEIKNGYFKAEWYNLSGSIKDRVALGIIESAYKSGELKPGQEIIETTSGNMGLALASVGTKLGHKIVIFMPKFMSEERKQLLRLYGAKLMLTDSFEEAFSQAKEYAKNGGFLALQFENKSNLLAHYSTTGVEIAKQTNNQVKGFVAGVGTSGTLMGVGKYLQDQLNIPIIAVEPYSSMILTSGKSQGKHKIQGLSDNIVPALYDKDVVSQIISVTDDDAIAMAQKLAQQFGLGVGISSGANFIGAVLSNIDGIASVFPDDNKKYLTTDLSTPIKTPLVESIELIDFLVIK